MVISIKLKFPNLYLHKLKIVLVEAVQEEIKLVEILIVEIILAESMGPPDIRSSIWLTLIVSNSLS